MKGAIIMKAVLILAHGSREKNTEKTLEWVVEGVRKKLHSHLIEGAYLQFSEKDMEAGIINLMAKGAKDITIIPYFLFEGIHIREDIPSEIKALKQKYPEVTIHFGRILGNDERLVDILVDRIQEAI